MTLFIPHWLMERVKPLEIVTKANSWSPFGCLVGLRNLWIVFGEFIFKGLWGWNPSWMTFSLLLQDTVRRIIECLHSRKHTELTSFQFFSKKDLIIAFSLLGSYWNKYIRFMDAIEEDLLEENCYLHLLLGCTTFLRLYYSCLAIPFEAADIVEAGRRA